MRGIRVCHAGGLPADFGCRPVGLRLVFGGIGWAEEGGELRWNSAGEDVLRCQTAKANAGRRLSAFARIGSS